MGHSIKCLFVNKYDTDRWSVDKVTLDINGDPDIGSAFEVWYERPKADPPEGDSVTEICTGQYTPQQMSMIVKGVTQLLEKLDVLDDDESETARKIVEKIWNIS